MTVKKMLLTAEELQAAGQTTLTSSQNWTVPDGVYNISMMGVEQGAIGTAGGGGSNTGSGGAGGLGGNCRYLNSVSVYPGQVFEFTLTSNGFSVTSNGGTLLTGLSGGVSLGRAGSGVNGINGTALGGGGGGAGGLAKSISTPSLLVPGGGGGGGSGSGGSTSGGGGGIGEFPGGGGGGGGGSGSDGTVAPGSGGSGGIGGGGCLRIIWPGNARQFPSARTADEVSGEVAWGLVSHPEGSVANSSRGLCTDKLGTWLLLPSASAAAGTTYYLSTDGGKTFQARAFNVGSAATYNSCVRTDDAFIVTTSLGTILRSPDGITWSLVTVAAAVNIIASTYSAGVLVLGLGNKTLRRSTDQGITFTTPTTSAFTGFPNQAASGNGVVIIGDTTDNPKRSANAGASFTPMASGLFPNGGTNLLATFSDNRFIGTPGGSRAYLGNSDASVAFTSSLVPGTGVLSKVTHLDSRYYAAGTVSRFMEMKDSGTTWQAPVTITNNLVDTGISISQIESDGFGVTIVVGSYGLIMRGELK